MESRTKVIVTIVISCAILVGFICCMVAVFYTSPDTDPVLEFRPLPREENAGSTLIWYNVGNLQSIQHWVDSLNEFIKPYEDHPRDSYSKDCSEGNPANPKNWEVCKFHYEALEAECTKVRNWPGYPLWGYASQSPCVILKMNKAIGWVPDVYNKTDIEYDLLPESMPDDLKEHIKRSAWDNGGEPKQMVWVSCKGVNPADQEFIGEIEYTPWQGFPAFYFPYMEIPGYLSPIVAVRFVEPAANVLINIQCTAWAKNIKYSTKEPSGLVNFELLKD